MTGLRARLDDEAGVTLVELLVVMIVFGVVAAATTGVVTNTQRSEQFQQRYREVIDDGRVSLSRIRRQVRAARRVYATSCEGRATADCSPSSTLHFWVDQDQDNVPEDAEKICYLVRPLTPTSTDRWRLLRWDGAASGAPDTCDASVMPSSGVQVLAETLVLSDDDVAAGVTQPRPFAVMDPAPTTSPTDPPTRDVTVSLTLEVPDDRGPDSTVMETTVRLRNVA